jgi:PAS domain S-box-containing protein
MTVSGKISLVMGVFVSALLLTSAFVVHGVLLDGFQQAEISIADQNRILGTEAVDRELDRLQTVLDDWAPWDDAWEFVQSPNKRFEAQNLSLETISDMDLDLLLFLRPDGVVSWGTMVDYDNERLADPAPLAAALLRPDQPFLKKASRAQGVRGVMNSPQGPMFVLGRPIMHSDGSGPAGGILVFGRLTGRGWVGAAQKFVRQSGLAEMHVYDAARPDAPAAVKHLASSRQTVMSEVHDDHLYTYVNYPDIAGKSALILEIRTERRVMAHGMRATRLVLGGLAGIQALAIALLWLLLGRTVVQPIQRLTHYVTTLQSGTGPAPAALPVRRRDEIGLLAREFHGLLGQLTERQSQLQQQIAERQRSEEAEQSAKIRHRAVIDSMFDALVVSDAQGRILSINPAVEQMFGYAAEELIGQPVYVLSRTTRRQQHAEYLQRQDQGAYVLGRKRQVFGQRRNGEIFPIELMLTEFTTKDGRFFSAVMRDLSAEKAAETERRRLAGALHHAADAIEILDPAGNILYANPAYERRTGHRLEEIRGSRPEAIMDHSADEQKYREMRLTTQAGRPWSGRLRSRTPDGTLLVEDMTVSPIKDDKGQIASYVVVMRDVTEKATLETQLARAYKMEAIGQLAAGIAHEISAPAQSVRDNLRFLQDAFRELDGLLQRLNDLAAARKPLARAVLADTLQATEVQFLREEVPKAIGQSVDGAEQISQIVKAMKEFSDPTQEKIPLDLNRAIASTITVTGNEWKRVAEVRTEFDPALPPVVCMPGEFKQVILNMLMNAAHAIAAIAGDGSKGKGTITVTTRQAGDCVEIRISDTGIGISPEIRERIFDPFFTTKPPSQGTGQGLTIAHDVIVNRHHGSIALETQPGRGSTFIIRLPLRPTVMAAHRAA